jgi:hypothetical protein
VVYPWESVESERPEKVQAKADEPAAWMCSKCVEENPGHFDECWKCQTWRADDNKQVGNPPATVN